MQSLKVKTNVAFASEADIAQVSAECPLWAMQVVSDAKADVRWRMTTAS